MKELKELTKIAKSIPTELHKIFGEDAKLSLMDRMKTANYNLFEKTLKKISPSSSSTIVTLQGGIQYQALPTEPEETELEESANNASEDLSPKDIENIFNVLTLIKEWEWLEYNDDLTLKKLENLMGVTRRELLNVPQDALKHQTIGLWKHLWACGQLEQFMQKMIWDALPNYEGKDKGQPNLSVIELPPKLYNLLYRQSYGFTIYKTLFTNLDSTPSLHHQYSDRLFTSHLTRMLTATQKFEKIKDLFKQNKTDDGCKAIQDILKIEEIDGCHISILSFSNFPYEKYAEKGYSYRLQKIGIKEHILYGDDVCGLHLDGKPIFPDTDRALRHSVLEWQPFDCENGIHLVLEHGARVRITTTNFQDYITCKRPVTTSTTTPTKIQEYDPILETKILFDNDKASNTAHTLVRTYDLMLITNFVRDASFIKPEHKASLLSMCATKLLKQCLMFNEIYNQYILKPFCNTVSYEEIDFLWELTNHMVSRGLDKQAMSPEKEFVSFLRKTNSITETQRHNFLDERAKILKAHCVASFAEIEMNPKSNAMLNSDTNTDASIDALLELTDLANSPQLKKARTALQQCRTQLIRLNDPQQSSSSQQQPVQLERSSPLVASRRNSNEPQEQQPLTITVVHNDSPEDTARSTIQFGQKT